MPNLPFDTMRGSLLAAALTALVSAEGLGTPFQPPQLWKRQNDALHAELRKRAESGLNDTIPYIPKWFTQKVDHTDPSNNSTFKQRYWIGTTFYKPGGPVIVLEGGETSGAGRIQYMHTGIGRYLTEALGGIGIVLEHRYYGQSYVTPNLTVENLKYLNTAQSLADNAFFAENLWRDLPANLSHVRPSQTPFISYGGSYAGSKSAFLRVVYPEVYYGSLASSAVIWAGENFWEYNEPVRAYGDPVCIAILEETARRIDTYSASGGSVWQQFKELFGVKSLEDRDSASYIFNVLGRWQSGNWNKLESGATSWDRFCTNITTGVRDEAPEHDQEILEKKEAIDLEAGVRNFAAWTKRSLRESCGDSNITQCAGTAGNRAYSQRVSLTDGWKLWPWQVCTEWGYFMPGAPAGSPTLMPRIVDMPYLRQSCQDYFGMPSDFQVDVSKVLQYGGYNLTAPRLMYIDGTHDPWLYATAHSPHSPQKDRDDNLSVFIPEAWHHNDENGLGDISKEPQRIQDVHNLQIKIVRGWVEEFYKENGQTGTTP
ncbi:hypothetical protein Dda_4240 [Drechslerella dactyloides]|uniref:Extracelular serine carboxypeptidase n=1 Tax=Drechslerella dactyloides TaxID=74499 RepID=A0AAD6J1Q0_DREDA|nr:hypothetical protein Dda_4240 [Drechslerella dactyloides]